VDRKIDPGLFARLMQMSAPARKDLLEYIGQGPTAMPPLADPVPEADRTPLASEDDTSPTG
jgi:hypothetical protein